MTCLICLQNLWLLVSAISLATAIPVAASIAVVIFAFVLVSIGVFVLVAAIAGTVFIGHHKARIAHFLAPHNGLL